MFNSNISINDNAAASKTFNQVYSGNRRSERIDTSSTASLPRQMVIAHTAYTPKGAPVKTDRHLLQFSVEKADSNAVEHVATVNLTIAVPQTAAIVRADIDHLLAFVKNWIGVTANVDGILLGEY